VGPLVLRLVGLAALLASPAAAAPQRVASLNLCTDELVLLLADRRQLVSVTRLGADPQETPLAPRAAGLHRNNGRLESVAGLVPDLVITGGGANRYAAELARRMGTRVVDVPPPTSLAELRRNVRTVAAALGRPARGEALVRHVDAQLGRPPARPRRAVLLSGGGYTVRPDSLAAELARHAGLAQQAFPAERVALDRLIADPPDVIVVTRYRARQASLHQMWLAHPALKRLPARTRLVEIDGRSWTCLGPLVADDVARLRARLM
jgi:iron complex transport system substrate-binding protein